MTYCEHCGNELAEGASFCAGCGEKVQLQVPNSTSPKSIARETKKTRRTRLGFRSKEGIAAFIFWIILGLAIFWDLNSCCGTPYPTEDLLLGAFVVAAPWLIVDSIISPKGKQIFTIVALPFALIGIAYIVMGFSNWDAFMMTPTTIGLWYILTGFAVLIGLAAIRSSGRSQICPNCKNWWATGHLKSEELDSYQSWEKATCKQTIRNNLGEKIGSVDIPVVERVTRSTAQHYFRCRFCSYSFSKIIKA